MAGASPAIRSTSANIRSGIRIALGSVADQACQEFSAHRRIAIDQISDVDNIKLRTGLSSCCGNYAHHLAGVSFQ